MMFHTEHKLEYSKCMWAGAASSAAARRAWKRCLEHWKRYPSAENFNFSFKMNSMSAEPGAFQLIWSACQHALCSQPFGKAEEMTHCRHDFVVATF